MKLIPAEAAKYLSTEEYTEVSVDQSFFEQQHRTAEGVWSKIVVIEGHLTYRILEPEVEEVVLTSSVAGVVEPMVLHQIKPIGRLRFYVEFYR